MRLLILAVSVLAASAANATLAQIDLLAPGDGLVTRDSVSGLDWLDTSQTLGLSHDGIVAGAGGFSDAGWRHATAAEVCGLLAQAGASPSPCPGVFGSRDDRGQLLLDLLGVTAVVSQEYDGGTLTLHQIWAVFDDTTGILSLHGELELSVDHHTAGWVNTYVRLEDDYVSGSAATNDSQLLVRAVPEPSTAFLLAAGLAALAVRRR